MYRQGLHPQISQGLYFQYYPLVDEVIQAAYHIENNLRMHKKTYVEIVSRGVVVSGSLSR